jgi:hypothetical protein
MEQQIEKGCFQGDSFACLLNGSGLELCSPAERAPSVSCKYPEENRTPFEEHLVEAAKYAFNGKDPCTLHFTVSPEHLDRFQDRFNRVGAFFEKTFSVTYDIGFSIQKPSTDTLAVDLENRPFRLDDGRLLFRPGGHGALLENLNDLKGDIVFIKNIDNVVPDYLKTDTYLWKKILGGCLISVQNKIAHFMDRLSSESDSRDLFEKVTGFMEKTLKLRMPPAVQNAGLETKRNWIVERLDRPVRVCGMVRNTGEPGGGPFWVEDPSGEQTLQIVETAQVDPDDDEQQTILSGATHFNPVDLVCGVRNWQGEPFDLRRFTDPETVFISTKSKDGKELKALEHPGLWNGSMARWISLFVEVPAITFNPVKTVNDLLRKEHQPLSGQETA